MRRALWPGVIRLTFMNAAQVEHGSAGRNILSRAGWLCHRNRPLLGHYTGPMDRDFSTWAQQYLDGCHLSAGEVARRNVCRIKWRHADSTHHWKNRSRRLRSCDGCDACRFAGMLAATGSPASALLLKNDLEPAGPMALRSRERPNRRSSAGVTGRQYGPRSAHTMDVSATAYMIRSVSRREGFARLPCSVSRWASA
jgi:hypothetical protein